MAFDRFRKHKPVIHTANPEKGGVLNPSINTTWIDIPVKWEANTRSEMSLLRRYTHGDLKYENTGRTSGNCVNYYPDKNGSRTGGRCKAKGFIEVHEDWPADHKPDFVDPSSGLWLKDWPACPLFVLKERLSRR